jgi:membrane-associated protein
MPLQMLHHLPFLHEFSYAGMTLVLAGTGIILPIPEEVILLTAGYLAAEGFMDPFIAIPLAILGTLVGDSILFALAKAGSPFAEKLRNRLRKLNVSRTWFFSHEHPLRAVFFLRFVTGLRILSPIYAGFHAAKWPAFLATTFAALVIFIPLTFGIGYYFNDSLAHLLHGFAVFRHILFLGLLLFVGLGTVLAAYHYIRRGDRSEG